MVHITFQPSGKRISLEKGSLLEAAHGAGIPLRAECGGKGRCGKCKVQIEGHKECSGSEIEFFTLQEIEQGIHLACQVFLTHDVTVLVPEESLVREQRILVEGVTREVLLEPGVRKIFLKLPIPSLQDIRTDIERIKGSIDIEGISVDTELLHEIPLILRESDFEITLVLLKNKLVHCEKGDTTSKSYGVAFDIGTTTIVGYLLDLTTGKELAVKAAMNPQIKFGDDIISRINYAQKEETLNILTTCVRECLSRMMVELSEGAHVPVEEIYEVVVAGNTCMHHLFLGIPPKSLAVSPFIPVTKEALYIRSPLYGKRMYVLPLIGGFVGADTVADLIAYPMDNSVRLLIDIGTNCEVVLGTEDRIVVCSAAAGPAFEGAHISCGMRAAPGAIEEVELCDEISIKTIDDEEPRGIAGSGLISITAEMLRKGIIDGTGRFQRNNFSRVKDDRFVLMDSIFLTQKDLREIQLAKGAIFAAQRILLKMYGVGVEEIKEVALAGAFGSLVPKEAAILMGLIFDLPLERIKSVGNAAGSGAKLCLLSLKERERAEEISKNAEYVELSMRKDFEQEFMDAMYFPHADLGLFPRVRRILAETSPYFQE